jgi:hypothetical protein
MAIPRLQLRPLTGALATLTASAVLAGCGGSISSLAPSGQSISPMTTSGRGPASVRPLAAISCTLSSKENFNNDPIAGGYIWFTSIFDVPPGQQGLLRFHMYKSSITFTNGSQTYTINTPDSRISLHDPSNINSHVNFAPALGNVKHDVWWLMVPYGTSGNDFLNEVAWPVPSGGLPGGIQNVTWTAKFSIAKHGVGASGQPIQWRWGAAVYTQLDNFPSDYNQLNVKDLDDPNYGPYFNSDPAGTPENDKQYLTTGGTQNGNQIDYIGGAGNDHVTNICQ